MFRVLNNNNVENALYIQGARPGESLSSIASLVFQNQTSNIGSISAIAASNGHADVVIQTKNENILSERLRITHDGRVGIGNTALSNKFNVEGSIYATQALNASNINAQVLEASNLLAQKYSTQKILFTRDTSSNVARNITLSFRSNEVLLDASCIVSGTINPVRIPTLSAAIITTGTLNQSVFPANFILNSISVSNLTTLTNASTPRITFIKGSNVALIATGCNVNIVGSNIDAFGDVQAKTVRVGFPNSFSDAITVFHGMSNWNMTSSNTMYTGHSTFSRMNSVVTVSFRCTLVIGTSNQETDLSLPLTPKYSVAHTVILTSVESDNDIFGRLHLYGTSNNMRIKCASLDPGNWHVSGTFVYEHAP
jgi:hypothetical protein